MRVCALLGVLIPFLASADPLLDRARETVRARLDETPNVTCLLEIEREVFPTPSASHFQTRNRTRLEVSFVDGRELYAWPGEAFVEQPLTAFLGPGVASTGEFSTHGRTVFLDPRTEFVSVREPQRRGVRVYDYQVPVEASRYVYMVGGRPIVTAYRGTVHIDEMSAQVTQFELVATSGGSASGIRETETAIRYEVAQVSGREVWLPSVATLSVDLVAGPVGRNKMTYRDCRAYGADTTITFSASDDDVGTRRQATLATRIPKGEVLPIETTTTVSSEHSWAGDELTAIAYKALRVGRAVLIPKGAHVHGRILRLDTVDTTETLSGAGRRFRISELTLRLDRASWDGGCATIAATLQVVDRIPQMARTASSGGAQLPSSVLAWTRAATYESGRKMSQRGHGRFVVRGEMFIIEPGARMRWVTEEPSPASESENCSDRAAV